MVTREGLEPPTFWFVAKRSNPTELPGRVVVDKEYIITAVIHCQMFFEKIFYFFGIVGLAGRDRRILGKGRRFLIKYIGLSVISGIFL